MSGKNNGEKLSEIDSHVTKHYNIIKRLGKGAYGIVWKAIDKKSKETVAVKKIFDAFRNQTDAQRTFREIMFLLSFSNHENIIQLIGLHKANNDRDIYLVFEFMGIHLYYNYLKNFYIFIVIGILFILETDLHNVIKRGNILKDIHKVFIMYQLFKATKYIHSGNVIHRDLKPSNILLNAQCHCKIADFGLARSVTQIGEGDGETGSDPTLTDYVATRWYRAPEILIASKKYTKGIDMWSLGCILGEMLLEKPLFPGSSTINQVERIMATLPPPTPQDIISVSAGYGSNLLEKIPNISRRTLQQIFIGVPAKALDLIERLIVFNPNHRLTAVEALEHPYVADFHHRAHEPERGTNVIPPLRDDVQLRVEDYRNKLYAMMDEKHRKHKNMSKPRIRRISEHIRKDTGQGDAVAKKNFEFCSNDLRKEREFNESFKQSHNPGSKSNISQYAHNLINGNFPSIAPSHTKSCQFVSHHQHNHNHNHHHQQQQQQQSSLTKSQRSVQSDQMTGYGVTNKSNNTSSINQPTKLRRGIKSQGINNNINKYSTIINGSNAPSRYSLAKRANNQDSPTSSINSVNNYITKIPNNITKHFAMGTGSNGPIDNNNSLESQVILNYLNQTIPLRTTAISAINGNNRTSAVNNNNVINRHRNDNNINETIGGYKITRSQTLKNNLKHIAVQKQSNVRNLRSMNNYNQNHGVITASAYSDLKNGSVKW
ncbi:mitogen-activated protein kinase 15-like isoform X3 [Microplitis mediator]|uniref:mitogen-activated protein kinase 15-like isoform X3 n=1 Tax=Microplitis mediator TaxID=375433 RepID=UPI0025575B46|nr:mitogen-activated protein kinase 15-like isoform X3 [Microplitis mediator]